MAEAQEETVEYGGYEYKFVDKLDPKFYCIICQKVLCDPVLTGCCGQHCCDSCLQQWYRASYVKTCPHCRKVNFPNVIDKPLKREVDSLKVYCVNYTQGCRWKNELCRLARHLSSENDGCGYAKVECVLQCGEKLERGKLSKHLQYECPQRPYECGYCGHEDTYASITGETKITKQSIAMKKPAEKGHYKTCKNFVKQCPNQCGETMKRKEIERHRQECPREIVECQFAGPNATTDNQTCGQKMLQSELSKHQRECLFRKFECKFCGTKSTYTEITGEKEMPTSTKRPSIPPEKSHYVKCPKYPLFCVNKCQSTKIERSSMDKHLEVCPLQLVTCPFSEAGCLESLCRKDLNKHLSNNQAQHLATMCTALVDTKKELSSVKKELVSVKEESALAIATVKEDSNRELARVKKRCALTERKLEAIEEAFSDTKRELAAAKRDLHTLTLREALPEPDKPPVPERVKAEPRRRSFLGWKRK